jgi:hypothetical protein
MVTMILNSIVLKINFIIRRGTISFLYIRFYVYPNSISHKEEKLHSLSFFENCEL